MSADRLAAGDLELTGDDYHYLIRVRRLAAGDQVELFDGAGRAANAELTAVMADRATLRVAEPREVEAQSAVEITVILSLIKGDRTEWAIQKLVELGVNRIVPTRAERCVVRLEGKRAEERHRRYVAVATDAARQCGRATVPDIAPVADLAGALAAVPAGTLRLMLWEQARGESLRTAVEAAAGSPGIAILVGPEGGFTPAEAEFAAAAGWRPVGLGPRILRSETAAIAAAAVVAAAVGNLD